MPSANREEQDHPILEQLEKRICIPVGDQQQPQQPTQAPQQPLIGAIFTSGQAPRGNMAPIADQDALMASPPQQSFQSPPPTIQSFIHVPSAGSQVPQATQSATFSQLQQPTQQQQSTQIEPTIRFQNQTKRTPEKAQPNWKFQSNPHQHVPLLELQRQHYKLNQKYQTTTGPLSATQMPTQTQARPTQIPSQRMAPIQQQQSQRISSDSVQIEEEPFPRRSASRPSGNSSFQLVVDSNAAKQTPMVQIPGCSPPTTAPTSPGYSRPATPRPQGSVALPSQTPATELTEMADFTDEKQTVDLCSDQEGDGVDLVAHSSRAPPPDMDGGAAMRLIPQDAGSILVAEDDQFDCSSREAQLRKDLEIARQFFGAGAVQSGMIQNPKVDEIRDSKNVKRENGRPFDEESMGVEAFDEDDDEIEIQDGVKQTASGHLLVQNVTGPVLSEQEQRAIAKRTRQEMKRRMDERNLVEYGGKCDDEKFVDFSHWPQEFTTMQEAIDTYNKLGLPHRIMFRIADHMRDTGGISTRFRLVCFHNKTLSGQAKNMQNSTTSSIQFKKNKQNVCPVSMTFKFKPEKPHSKRGQFLRSNHCIMQHNHALTVDERRVLQRVEIQDEIQMYLESGLTMPMIVNCVNRKFGLSLPYNAFCSVVQKVRHSIHSYIDFTQTQTMQLLQMLEKMRQEDPMTRFAYLFDSHMKQRDDIDPNNPQIEALLIQTPLMARNYQAYHDVVFLDSTYNTNQLGLALAILSGISSEGKNVFLGIAFMARETTENYQWVLENFVKMNNNLSPRTILTDYDSAMATAIETVFSRQTTHWLCQWHMMQNFKKHFVFLSKRRGAAGKLLFNHIIDSIFTESPKKFAELSDVIFSSDILDEKRLGYLRKMFMIKEKWATAHQPPIFNAGMHTTSRVEAMNSMVKKAMQSRYTLVNLFQEILKIEQRVIRASREVLNHVDHERVVNNPLMASIREHYSKWAFERMLYQHMMSHTLMVTPLAQDGLPTTDKIFRLAHDRTVFKVRDAETNDKTTVVLTQNSATDPLTGATFDHIRCNCRYFLSHEFFCNHIFAVLNLLQVRTAEKFHPTGRRWQKNHQEQVLPGLYSAHDRTLNPEQYANQFRLYGNNGNVNQNYVFSRGPGGSGGFGPQNAIENGPNASDMGEYGHYSSGLGGGISGGDQQDGEQDWQKISQLGAVDFAPVGSGAAGKIHNNFGGQQLPPESTDQNNSGAQGGDGGFGDARLSSEDYGAAAQGANSKVSRRFKEDIPGVVGESLMDMTFHKRRSATASKRRNGAQGDSSQVKRGRGKPLYGKSRKTKEIDTEKLMKKMRQKTARDSQLICGTSGSERSDEEDDLAQLTKKQRKMKVRQPASSGSDSDSSSDSSSSESQSQSSKQSRKRRGKSESSSQSSTVISMSSNTSLSGIDDDARSQASSLDLEFPTLNDKFVKRSPRPVILPEIEAEKVDIEAPKKSRKPGSKNKKPSAKKPTGEKKPRGRKKRNKSEDKESKEGEQEISLVKNEHMAAPEFFAQQQQQQQDFYGHENQYNSSPQRYAYTSNPHQLSHSHIDHHEQARPQLQLKQSPTKQLVKQDPSLHSPPHQPQLQYPYQQPQTQLYQPHLQPQQPFYPSYPQGHYPYLQHQHPPHQYAQFQPPIQSMPQHQHPQQSPQHFQHHFFALNQHQHTYSPPKMEFMPSHQQLQQPQKQEKYSMAMDVKRENQSSSGS